MRLPVAVLGILIGGKTCVPLDPNSSATWLASKLTALDVSIVLCDSITAPLFAKNKIVGVMSVQALQPHAFDQNHLRLLTSIAGQAALAPQSEYAQISVHNNHL